MSTSQLFEKMCFWLKPLDGKRLTSTSLRDDSTVEFLVPAARKLLPHDWKETAELVPDVLYAPRIANLESGDAFYLVSHREWSPFHRAFSFN